MAVSRRSVLLQGSAIGAGILTANITGLEALAQAQLPRRRSIGDMAADDPVLEAWREGVARLRERPASERISWANLAAIHGTQSGFNRCPHGNWYFLPWHRAYLLMYENIIREVANYPEFALPYWDWTRDRRMPRHFTERNVNGRPNPLYEESRTMGPQDSLPDENVGPDVLRDILSQANFEVFGTSRPRGQDSADAEWISRRTGNQGPLEANPHNNVHAIVGGIMASARSANDPIFLMHHCNVDRIWTLWNAAGNQNTTANFWLDMEFRNHFLDPEGQEYSARVRDLQDPRQLGYTYGIESAVAEAPPPEPEPDGPLAALRERLRDFFRRFGDSDEEATADGDAYTASRGVKSPQLASADEDPNTFEQTSISGQGEATRPLEVAIKITGNLIENTAKRLQDPGSGFEYLNLPGLREQSARKPRCLAFIRNIDCTKIDATMIRVFVDCDYLSQGTPISDDHYAGTFGFFGNSNSTSEGHGGAHGSAMPSMVVDLTETLEKLYGGATPPESLRVQLLPAPNLNAKVADCGRVIPASIEIAFV